jgi:histidinol-phosphate/aromatic aminotransferase/cobyric acid decarboxylase-like protein
MQIYNKYEKDYLRACDKFIATRDELEKELRQVKFLRIMPSQANYFLCEILPPFTANGLVLTMLKKFNILMRDCSDKKGLDGKQYMRIAVRCREDNKRLVAALSELGKGA